jgi:hypothetical protein
VASIYLADRQYFLHKIYADNTFYVLRIEQGFLGTRSCQLVESRSDTVKMMGQMQYVEIIIRGDLMIRQIIRKIGERLQETDIDADFSSTIVVPPWRMATKIEYPSLAVLHAEVMAKDMFRFEALLQELLEQEQCQLIALNKLEKR